MLPFIPLAANVGLVKWHKIIHLGPTLKWVQQADSSVYSVMSYGFSPDGFGWMNRSDPTSSSYMIDDVIALQHLYGIDTSFSAGDNIYDYSFFQ